ncbi:MAG: hypothetical protein E7353_04155 [Clostridiales bacterium]|nr:hypothetical protein [Clostridiales bacterium]
MLTKLSQQTEKHTKIPLDNLFITEYMPSAPEDYVKVYLLGYSYALSSSSDTSISSLCATLNISESDARSAFKYWETQGLVLIVEDEPLLVEYLPVHSSAPIRKFSKSKYEDFNNQLHAMLPSRQFLPSEYNEYYSVIEDCHLEPEAMLAIIAYCIRLKGDNVNYRYIIAVAKRMAEKNLLTFARIEEELSQYDAYSSETAQIMKALGSRKTPDHEDRNLFLKWTKDYGFTVGTVIEVAKLAKGTSFARLDRLLTKYYENHLFTIEEITSYIQNRDKIYDLTRSINRIIGVYYEQLDHEIETYISGWLNKGFNDESLKRVAEYCFLHNVKTLDGMNEKVNTFYSQGAITVDSINEVIERGERLDNVIKEILTEAGTTRTVTARDRESYRTWTQTWKMSKDLILYAASLSKGAINPIAYINSLLASWFNKKVDSVQKAKELAPTPAVSTSVKTANKVEKTYTSEQLNAMFSGLTYEDM